MSVHRPASEREIERRTILAAVVLGLLAILTPFLFAFMHAK